MADIVTDLSIKKNWNVARGFNNTFTFTFTQSGGGAFVTTTYTFSLQIRRFGSTVNTIELTQGSGITNGGASGIVTVVLTGAQSALLTDVEYFWQLTVVHPDTFTYRWYNGTLVAKNEIYSGDTASGITTAISINGTSVTGTISIAGSVTLSSLGTTLQTASADTPLDADTFNFYDAVDAILKKITWANIKATLKTYFDTTYVPNYELITATGTDTYAATVTPTPSLTNGFKFQVKFTNTNTGASTLNVNGIGAVTLRKHDGTTLSSGDIAAGSDWWAVYDGTASQWRLLGGGGSTITAPFANTAFVETTGNDVTGQLGNPLKPYLTIGAALDALPATGGVVKIGIGDFTAPVTDPDGASKVKNNVSFEGSKMPWINSSYTINTFPTFPSLGAITKLENGTVIKGSLTFIGRYNIRLKNLGVDVGSDFCTATGGSYASGGNCIAFADANSGSGSAPTTISRGIVIENVITLGQSLSAAFHGVVLESSLECKIDGLYTFYNTHGLVSKTLSGIFNNIWTHGHASSGIYLKSDVYAPNAYTTLSNFNCRSIVAFDSDGLIIEANNASSFGISVSNGFCVGTKYGVTMRGSTTLNHVSLDNVYAGGCQSGGFRTTGSATAQISLSNCKAVGNSGDGFNWEFGNIKMTGCWANANTDGMDIQTNAAVFAEGWSATSNTGYGTRNAGIFRGVSKYYAANTSGTETGAGTFVVGFYDATPITKPTATTDLGTVLSNLGLRAPGTAFPITTTANIKAANNVQSFSTTATAAGTTTLTVSSNYFQTFTGATTQTVTLPVVTTLTSGHAFRIVNNSSGVVTVQTSGANSIKAMAAGSYIDVWVVDTAGGTGTASWNWIYTAAINN